MIYGAARDGGKEAVEQLLKWQTRDQLREVIRALSLDSEDRTKRWSAVRMRTYIAEQAVRAVARRTQGGVKEAQKVEAYGAKDTELQEARKKDRSAYRCAWCGALDRDVAQRVLTGWVCSAACFKQFQAVFIEQTEPRTRA
jgi:rubrerythrin